MTESSKTKVNVRQGRGRARKSKAEGKAEAQRKAEANEKAEANCLHEFSVRVTASPLSTCRQTANGPKPLLCCCKQLLCCGTNNLPVVWPLRPTSHKVKATALLLVSLRG